MNNYHIHLFRHENPYKTKNFSGSCPCRQWTSGYSISWNIRLDLFPPTTVLTHTPNTRICIELPYWSGSWVRGSVPSHSEIKELLVLEQLWENK